MIIKCYECGKERSNACITCPHCGAIANAFKDDPDLWWKLTLCMLGTAVILGLIIFVFIRF